jgi:hypothetical protein
VRSQLFELPMVQRRLFGGLAFLLCLVAFSDFWTMFATTMQRTSLVLLFVMMIGVPWFFGPKGNFAIPLKSIAFFLILLFAGFAVVSAHSAAPSTDAILPKLSPKVPTTAHPAASVSSPAKPSPTVSTTVHRAATVSSAAKSPSNVSNTVHKAASVPSPVKPSATDSTTIHAAASVSIPANTSLILSQPTQSRALTSIPRKPSLWSKIMNNAMKSLQHSEDVPDASNPRPFQFHMRKFLWQTAIADWRQNRIFGIGFILEVPSYMRPGWPNIGGFVDKNDPPVSGPHNSYLSVLARMGIIGLVLLIILTVQTFRSISALFRERPVSFTDAFFIVVPVNGAIHAVFNVGFESPHRCMLMWLFIGFLFARTSLPRSADYASVHRP